MNDLLLLRAGSYLLLRGTDRLILRIGSMVDVIAITAQIDYLIAGTIRLDTLISGDSQLDTLISGTVER